VRRWSSVIAATPLLAPPLGYGVSRHRWMRQKKDRRPDDLLSRPTKIRPAMFRIEQMAARRTLITA
jgi:hypothetical protein